MDRPAPHRHRLLGFVICGLLLLFLPHLCRAAAPERRLPLGVRAMLAKVGPLIEQQHYAQAIQLLTKFKARGGPAPAAGAPDPKGYHHAEIYYTLGTCHLLQSDFPKATAAFEQALLRAPHHVSAWLNLAKATYESGHYARSAECFQAAYDHSKTKDPIHLYYSAAAFLMAKQTAAGLNVFERLFDSHPQEIKLEWRENFVHALLDAGRPRQALVQIRHLAETFRGEKQVQWQEILLYQYLALDMRPQALAYAERLTREAPLNPKWWQALTHVCLQEEQYERALTALMVRSYLAPLSTREIRLLADLNLQLGIPLKAAALYESAIEEKKDGRLVQNLTLALVQLGKPEAALAVLERFPQKSREPELRMQKADILYNLGRFEEAADLYRQTAAEDTRQKGRAWLMAGYAALQAKDIKASRCAFKKAAAFKNHRKAALLAIQRLPQTAADTVSARSSL
jgi:tetratricopeptide (TPR) repeat protein